MKIQFVDKNLKKLWEPFESDPWYFYPQDTTSDDRISSRIELKKLSEPPFTAATKICGLVLMEWNSHGAIGYWVDLHLITIVPTNHSLILQFSNCYDDLVYEFDDRVIVESYIRRMAVATARTICEIQQRLNAEKITEYEADFWQQAEKDNYIAKCLDISAFKEVPANYPEILPTILHEELEKAKKRLTQPRSQCQYCDYYIPPKICNAFHTPSEDVINCPDYIALDRDRRNALQ